MAKILFLDFDGVISTNRAWIAQKHIEDFYLRWLDPIACSMLRVLLDRLNYQIVVTSTWRKFGFQHVSESLAAHDLARFLHPDWQTGDKWTFGVNSKLSRPEEIDEWLAKHPEVTDWFILDDDSFTWTDEQAARWIKTDGLNGFSTQNFEAVLNLFNIADDIQI